jgi:hypothetical protein
MRVGECTNDQDLVSALSDLKQERMNNRQPFEVVWWNNIALIAGDHYSEYSSMRGEFLEPVKEDHEIRLVINQARVVARQELSKITKSRPVMEIMPRSSDDNDIAAAKVGSFALDAAEWKFRLRRRRRQALWWTLLTGVSGIYVGWDASDYDDGVIEFAVDPTTGDAVYHPDRIEQLKKMAQTGEIPEVDFESWPLGDLEFKVYSPFQLLPDDTVMDWEDIADIITVDVVELEQAKDQWPDAAKDIQSESVKPSSVVSRMLRRAGLGSGQVSASEDVVNVYSYWLKPGVYDSKYLESGKMVRWCNQDTKLEVHDHCPYNDGRLPFAFFTHTQNATAIWPDCTITDIRPINLELDKTISQLLENRDYMVNPMWRIAEQVQLRKVKSQPGGMVKYVHVRDVPAPDQIPGVPLPTQVENLVVGLRDMILDVSGMGEVSRGRVPSGVRAGNMLAFLQEEDETKIGPIIEDFEDSIARMASLTLSRYSQFYTTQRILRAYKPGGQADVRKFKGSDLKNNTDVVVQAGSALPKLKSAKQQYVLQLVQLGIMRDPKQIKDMLELGEGEPDEIDMAFAQADRENDLMLRSVQNQLDEAEQSMFQPAPSTAAGNGGPPQGPGMMQGMGGGEGEIPPEMAESGGVIGEPGGMPGVEGGDAELAAAQEELAGMPGKLGIQEGSSPSSFAVPVKKWHIHEAHIKRHRRVMMGAEFEKLALTHPDVVRIFDEHISMHEQALQEQQMQQLQMMQAAQGGPAQTAPPPGAQPMADSAAVAASGEGP